MTALLLGLLLMLAHMQAEKRLFKETTLCAVLEDPLYQKCTQTMICTDVRLSLRNAFVTMVIRETLSFQSSQMW